MLKYILAVGLSVLLTNSFSQSFGTFNLYQLGNTSFRDPAIGTQTIKNTYPCFQAKAMNKSYFMAADASVLFIYLLNVVDKNNKTSLPVNSNGYSGFDMGSYSLRLGGMAGKVGIGVDMDMRALFLNGPNNYHFNDNKFISDFNFGLVLTTRLDIGKSIAYSPTIGYDMMFTERQTSPIDGNLFLFENTILINIIGGFGITLEPDWQYRSVRMASDDKAHGSVMFAFRFGLCYVSF